MSTPPLISGETMSNQIAPRLNLDIFQMTYDLIGRRRDVSVLMRTCKALYRAGIPPLLRFPVTIHMARTQTKKIESFTSFMLSENWSTLRFLSLRSLGLEASDVPKEYEVLAQELTIILRQATRLRVLELHWANELLAVYPNLFDSITSLPSLQRLAIRDGGSLTMNIVSAIRSPIKDLELSWHFGIKSNFPDPLVHLGHLGSTLVSLYLRRVDLRDRQIRLPSVRYLTIETSQHIRSAVLLHAFPNLSILITDTNTQLFSRDIPTASSMRQTNSTQLSTLGHQWNSPLLKLGGQVLRLFSLGIATQVHYLRVYCVDDLNYRIFCKLIDIHRPKVISVDIVLLSEYPARDDGGNLFESIFQCILPSCTHLRLNFMVCRGTMGHIGVSPFFELEPFFILTCVRCEYQFALDLYLGNMPAPYLYISISMDEVMSMECELIPGLGPWFKQGTARYFEPYILSVARNAPRLKRIGFAVEKSTGERVGAFWDIFRGRNENGRIRTTLTNIGWKEGDAEWTRAIEEVVVWNA